MHDERFISGTLKALSEVRPEWIKQPPPCWHSRHVRCDVGRRLLRSTSTRTCERNRTPLYRDSLPVKDEAQHRFPAKTKFLLCRWNVRRHSRIRRQKPVWSYRKSSFLIDPQPHSIRPNINHGNRRTALKSRNQFKQKRGRRFTLRHDGEAPTLVTCKHPMSGHATEIESRVGFTLHQRVDERFTQSRVPCAFERE